MNELSEVGLLTIITICSSLLIIIIKIIMKSKCNRFKFCCLEIDRDIKAENDIEIQKIEHNIKSDDNININDVLSNIKNNNVIK
jgi:hypothetical protein